MFLIFNDGNNGGMGFQACAYTINTYTGGLGEAITTNASEAIPLAYQERNGFVYIWESGNNEPKDESEYVLILSIEDGEHLTPIKTTEKDLVKLSKLVYMGNYYELKAMSDDEAEQVERDALTKLLLLRDDRTDIELLERKYENNTDNVCEYDELDVKPSYPGGEMALMTYIAKNIKYPQSARDNGIQGRVFVGFIIEANGSISNVEVVKGIGGGCDEEAVRVVKSMSKWHPGKKQGRSVRVKYMVPISFRLN